VANIEATPPGQDLWDSFPVQPFPGGELLEYSQWCNRNI